MLLPKRLDRIALSCVVLCVLFLPSPSARTGGASRTAAWLRDPFAKEPMTKVATLEYVLTSPNSGTGANWVYDTKLPLSGTVTSGKDAEAGARSWAVLGVSPGFIDAIVEQAHGTAYAKAYTLALPRSGIMEGRGGGFRAAIGLSVWGPSANGMPQTQPAGLLGLLLWEDQGSPHWKAERWDWPGKSSPQKTVVAGGDGAPDFASLRTYVDQIANGRPVGYYEVSVAAASQERRADARVHARLAFDAEMVLPELVPRVPRLPRAPKDPPGRS